MYQAEHYYYLLMPIPHKLLLLVMKELDTDSVEPTTHVLMLKDVYREDAVRDSLRREDVLSNAPSSDESFVKVPRIIEGAE